MNPKARLRTIGGIIIALGTLASFGVGYLGALMDWPTEVQILFAICLSYIGLGIAIILFQQWALIIVMALMGLSLIMNLYQMSQGVEVNPISIGILIAVIGYSATGFQAFKRLKEGQERGFSDDLLDDDF